MAYGQWTKCVAPANYSGPVPLTTSQLASVGTILVLLSVALGDLGVATLGVIIYAITYCHWWLYGRLVCLGGNQCAIGLALSVYPPAKKTDFFDREDTDYSVYLLLAPTTLYEDIKLAEQDAQGVLIAEFNDPDFKNMMSNYKGLGFVGEPEPLTDIVNPQGQSPNAVAWVANNFFLPGTVILDGNSNLQSCITQGLSGGSEPDWQTQPGQTTADGFINWVCAGHYSVLTQEQLDDIGLFNPGPWSANTQYKLGDLILDGNGYMQSCTTPGTSGMNAPAAFNPPLTGQGLVGSKTNEAGSNVTWINIGIGATWSATYNDSTSGWMHTCNPPDGSTTTSASGPMTYSEGNVIIDNKGNLQACIKGGNSGSVSPAWLAQQPSTTTDGQATWLTTPNPVWAPNSPFYAGAQIIDSNGKTQRCISPGTSGTAPPAWSDVVGQTTQDNEATWICVGKFTNSIGTLEIEFEGSGMYDFYMALLIASPFAALAAAVGWIPGLGWLLALLLSLLAALIAGIGFAVGRSGAADADPNADDPNIGTIYPGQDVLIVMGTWIYDSAHAGWNELHPVLHCQKIAVAPPGDLAAGNPWVNLPNFSATNVTATIGQVSATRTGWCPLIYASLNPTTLSTQQLPQNGWTIHPLVDGCQPTDNDPPLK